MNYYIIFTIIIVLLLYYYYNSSVFLEGFTKNDIYFLSKEELKNVLVNNFDNYYNKFNKIDLYARQSKDLNDYLSKMNNSIVDINNEEKNKLIMLINMIDNKTRVIKLPYLDGIKFNNIPWKFGIMEGNHFEFGLSHTRNDIIIISKENLQSKNIVDLCKTLIHEKIHVYQKIYPDDVEIYLSLHNFKKKRKINENDIIRANPDTDEWIYTQNDVEYKAEYINIPTNLLDVNYYPCNTQNCEHPFEKMAIDISQSIII